MGDNSGVELSWVYLARGDLNDRNRADSRQRGGNGGRLEDKLVYPISSRESYFPSFEASLSEEDLRHYYWQTGHGD